jgi:hypothetical protein
MINVKLPFVPIPINLTNFLCKFRNFSVTKMLFILDSPYETDELIKSDHNVGVLKKIFDTNVSFRNVGYLDTLI